MFLAPKAIQNLLFPLALLLLMTSCNSISITKRKHSSGYFVQVKNSHLNNYAPIQQTKEIKLKENSYSNSKKVYKKGDEVDLKKLQREKSDDLVIPESKQFVQQSIKSKSSNINSKSTPLKIKPKAKRITKALTKTEPNWMLLSGVIKLLVILAVLFTGGAISYLSLYIAAFAFFYGSVNLFITFGVISLSFLIFTLGASIFILAKVKYFRKKRGLE